MSRGLIPFLLLVIPLLEIAVFILVGGEIGIIATLVMIFVTAIIGTVLLRAQGFHLLSRIQEKAATGENPGKDLIHGIMILIAGVLLLTPGFVTDAFGFLLFFPPFREFLWESVASRIVVRTAGGFSDSNRGSNYDGDESVIDLDRGSYSEKKRPGGKGDSPWQNIED